MKTFFDRANRINFGFTLFFLIIFFSFFLFFRFYKLKFSYRRQRKIHNQRGCCKLCVKGSI